MLCMKQLLGITMWGLHSRVSKLENLRPDNWLQVIQSQTHVQIDSELFTITGSIFLASFTMGLFTKVRDLGSTFNWQSGKSPRLVSASQLMPSASHPMVRFM